MIGPERLKMSTVYEPKPGDDTLDVHLCLVPFGLLCTLAIIERIRKRLSSIFSSSQRSLRCRTTQPGTPTGILERE